MADLSDFTKDDRPRYRNLDIAQILLSYRLPPPGIVSILHRISGALLFLSLPFLLFLFRQSLTSESSFAAMAALARSWPIRIVILVLSWAYLHHFCAGVRHLFMDFHFGMGKETGRQTAIWVLAVSLALTLVVALKLVGVF